MSDEETRVVVAKNGAPVRIFEDEERAREWALEEFGEYGSTIYPSVRYDTGTAQSSVGDEDSDE